MEIRKARIEDLEIIVRYNYNLAKETENKELNIEVVTNGVKALLEDENKGTYHVCVIGEKVVGQIMYTYEWSDWRNGTFLWVQSVYVDREFRKQGVFKALYSHIKAMCDCNDDIAGIRLYVEVENNVAKKTYETLGMYECNYNMYEYIKK